MERKLCLWEMSMRYCRWGLPEQSKEYEITCLVTYQYSCAIDFRGWVYHHNVLREITRLPSLVA
jgi:hypothetical protein